MCINFFVYYLIKKKAEMLCNIHNEITQPFLNPKGVQEYVSCYIKKMQQQKSFNIWHLVQMIWSTQKYRLKILNIL